MDEDASYDRYVELMSKPMALLSDGELAELRELGQFYDDDQRTESYVERRAPGIQWSR